MNKYSAMKRIGCFVLLFFLVSGSGAVNAAVRAYLDQSNVHVGDPVTLIVEVEGQKSVSPDFSVLKKSFQILGTSTSSNISIINGVTSSKKSWQVQLQPLHKGRLEIPAITVGTEHTDPLQLTVRDISPEEKARQRDHISLESEVDTQGGPVYVQQQITYTLKLYTDDTIVSGELFAPEVENGIVEQISSDKKYQVNRDGKTYDVIERRYVISPERSGTLTIPGARFEGKQVVQQRQRGGNDPFGFGAGDRFFRDTFGFGGGFFSSSPFGSQGKSIQTTSSEKIITVLPIPDEYHGTAWLPAEDVEIEDSWAKADPEFKVGEPVVRNLKLTARGVAGSQIPDIQLVSPEKVRIYPETKTTQTLTDGETVIGRSDQNITYIPNTAGTVTVPKITIDWWNTQTGSLETFTVPARTVTILPGEPGSDQGELEPAVDTARVDEKSVPPAETGNPQPEKKDVSPDPRKNEGVSRGLLYGLVLVVLIIFGIYVLIRRTRRRSLQDKDFKKSVADKPNSADQKLAMKALQQACKNNDASAAARHLLELGKIKWPDSSPTNLVSMADKVAPGAKEMRALDQYLYAGKEGDWQGEELWLVIKKGLQANAQDPHAVADELASLYPPAS